MNLPQVSFRIKERKINQHYSIIKKKEEDIAAKEAELAERERRVSQKEQELALREKALSDKENDKEVYVAVNRYSQFNIYNIHTELIKLEYTAT